LQARSNNIAYTHVVPCTREEARETRERKESKEGTKKDERRKKREIYSIIQPAANKGRKGEPINFDIVRYRSEIKGASFCSSALQGERRYDLRVDNGSLSRTGKLALSSRKSRTRFGDSAIRRFGFPSYRS